MGTFILFIFAAAAIGIAYIWGEDSGYKRGKEEAMKEFNNIHKEINGSDLYNVLK